MRFVIRRIADDAYLWCNTRGRREWVASLTEATRFPSFGDAAVRAEQLGFDARDIAVEPAP